MATELSSSMVAMNAPVSSSLGAMGPLLRKLDLLLAPEYRLPHPLKVGIEFLKEDLEDIGADLVEQSMVDFPSKMAKYWMDEVRELSYEIEDCVDSMMVRHTGAGTKIRSVHGHMVRRVKIARLPKVKPCTRISKIARFRTLAREASQRHKSYLVGIDDSKIKLIQSLTNEAEHQLKVVPIVGPAGVGKTTLAKELYRDLGRQYECRAFLRVSRKPDMIMLFRNLLSQVQRRQQHSDVCTVQDLIDTIRRHLQDKRYFIVIDDLWETSAWDIVNGAFPESNNCSRILATVENMDVALECCGNRLDNILKMRPLGNQDSGKLLRNRVFGFDHQCSNELKGVLYGIIKICGGLPLAVISVAGLLSRQPDNSELWHQVQTYISSIWNVNHSLEGMQKELLNLNYIDLPHHLKTCLLYLSVYPEGYTIWKVDLVKQWMAEGFISPTEGKDTYEVAESYFYELVNMGMIQPMQINYNDEVLSCTVHHIVLDLITQKSKQENFVTTVNYSQTITATKAYRLSLHFTKSKFAKEPAGVKLSNVRSLAFFGLLKCMPSIVEFKLLRVLNLEFWGNYDEHMSFNLSRISQLLQLRYFKISSDSIVELPCQMRGLQLLETLEINARISAIPLDIVHLPSLLHLRLRDEKILPDGIGCIRSLRTLEYFDLSSNSEDSVRSLGELTNLQDLHLVCSTAPSNEHLKRNLVALAYSLGKLGNLKSLTLNPGTLSTTVLFDSNIVACPPVFLQRLELFPPICIFSRLPVWIGHLHKLCNLKVVVRDLLMKDIDMLTGLPALTILSLYVRQPTAEVIVFNRTAFPVLKCFKFWCGVLCLAFQEEALPNLQRLKVGFNAHRGEQFGHMLGGVEHLLSLQVIDGRIGASAGAQELDRRAAESALRNSISKHLMSPRFNLQMIDNVDEEIPQLTDPPASSSYALIPDSEVCTSGLTSLRKRKDNTEYCQYPGCIKRARGASVHCAFHGGGSRCQTPRCQKAAQGKTAFCKGHGRGRRCLHLGCSKAAHGHTAFCIAHGGGHLCSHEGCPRAARGKSGLCIKHGDGDRTEQLNLEEIDGKIGADSGAEESDMTAAESVSEDIRSKHARSFRFGRQVADCIDKEIPKASASLRQMSSIESSSYLGKHVNPKECQYPGCVKGARGASGHCIAHGGGRGCHKTGCTSNAEGCTDYCRPDGGGGRRCSHEGCSRAAPGRSGLCIRHKRCLRTNCTERGEGNSSLCISHGSERPCLFAGCTEGALGTTPFCKVHFGGKRCFFDGGGVCTKSAYGWSDYCLKHGGGKRCTVSDCTKSAHGGTDFCLAHGGVNRCKFESCMMSVGSNTDICTRHGLRRTSGMLDLSLHVGEDRWDKLVESDSQRLFHNAQILGHPAPGSGALIPISRYQFQTDVKPGKIELAAPEGFQETKKGIEDEAHVGGRSFAVAASRNEREIKKPCGEPGINP